MKTENRLRLQYALTAYEGLNKPDRILALLVDIADRCKELKINFDVLALIASHPEDFVTFMTEFIDADSK
jgi:hypothetical protein